MARGLEGKGGGSWEINDDNRNGWIQRERWKQPVIAPPNYKRRNTKYKIKNIPNIKEKDLNARFKMINRDENGSKCKCLQNIFSFHGKPVMLFICMCYFQNVVTVNYNSINREIDRIGFQCKVNPANLLQCRSFF